MTFQKTRILLAAGLILLGAGVAAAESNLWLHVRVDGDHGERVSINLPLGLVEKAIPPQTLFPPRAFLLFYWLYQAFADNKIHYMIHIRDYNISGTQNISQHHK